MIVSACLDICIVMLCRWIDSLYDVDIIAVITMLELNVKLYKVHFLGEVILCPSTLNSVPYTRRLVEVCFS